MSLKRKDPVSLTARIRGSIKLTDLLNEKGLAVSDSGQQQISCPFHGVDRSRSARVYPETNSMHCFACVKSWDPISFTMQEQEIDFWHAVELLVNRYDVPVGDIQDRAAELKYVDLKDKKYFSTKRQTYIDEKSEEVHQKLVLARTIDLWKQLNHLLPDESFGKVLLLLNKIRLNMDNKEFFVQQIQRVLIRLSEAKKGSN